MTYSSSAEADMVEDVRPRSAVDAAERPAVNAPPSALPERSELSAVIDDFMRSAEEGEAEDGYGEQYTLEDLRQLHSSLSHVKSELGTMRIQAIRRWHVQGMLDELRRAGLAPGRLTAIVEDLNAVYRYAIQRGLVDDSPVIWLTFPQFAEAVRAPAMQERPRPSDPEVAREATPTRASTPVERPNATDAMVALGSRVLLWSVRIVVTIFVLIAIALVLQFA